MAHYRKMFDERFIGSWDLEGHESVKVTIEDVKREELRAGPGAAAEHKPVIYFKGKKKGMVCNRTNAKRIAEKHGEDVSEWVGKQIEIYVEKVSAFGAQHAALRVRV